MLSWFTKSSTAENGVSRHREKDPPVNDGRDVIYAAKNKKKSTSFVCSAPTGSRHATAIAEICGRVYTGTTAQDDAQRVSKERHTADERAPKGAKRLSGYLSGDSKRHRPEATQQSPRESTRAFCRRSTTSASEFDDDDDDDSTIAPSEVTSVSALSSVSSGTRYARQSDVDAPKGRHSARGFRHDDGAKTTFFLERDGRTIFVSAPKGSTEAAVFDAVAKKGVAHGVSIRFSNQMF